MDLIYVRLIGGIIIGVCFLLQINQKKGADRKKSRLGLYIFIAFAVLFSFLYFYNRLLSQQIINTLTYVGTGASILWLISILYNSQHK